MTIQTLPTIGIIGSSQSETSTGTCLGLVCLLGPLKCFIFLENGTCFIDLPIDTPLSQIVNGIAGQTNILSDSPLYVGHSNAIFYGIGCRVG